MGTTLRLRRHLREQPSSDLLRILSDVPQSQHDSVYTVHALTGEELRAACIEHRAAIVSDWIRHSPGTRPSAWWRFDSPEPRRLLSGEGGTWPACRWSFAFGLPTVWRCGEPTFETQSAYLRRLQLRLPGERRAIREPHPSPLELVYESWQGYSRAEDGYEARMLTDEELRCGRER
jgi:hypothetical protein